MIATLQRDERLFTLQVTEWQNLDSKQVQHLDPSMPLTSSHIISLHMYYLGA